MPKKTLIELLAPARNASAGIAAINHGADAVYIGCSKFGAREAAGNEINEIEQLVNYAHLFHAKVYVTINTILFNNELHVAERLIHSLYAIGVDAIIIQDMGILEMNLPPIPIHASTQTHNESIEHIRFLQEVGFERVILARELSTAEIGVIKKATNIELEAFVHGALCVSYSGQCYFSQAITGRSANRGACAQPCRSSYNLVDDKGNILAKSKHLLSLKDLNQSANIEALIDSGITSLKIEGRLKDVEYVKNVTAHYRKVIDSILAKKPEYRKASSGTVSFSFEPNPSRSFNRGFTSHFAAGRQLEQATINTQKAMGQYVGVVKDVSQNSFTLDSNIEIVNDDGLCFFSKNNTLIGVKVNRVASGVIYPLDLNSIFPGAKVYRNSDKAFSNLLSKNSAVRKVQCILNVEIEATTITFTLIDEDNIPTNLRCNFDFVGANDPEKSKNSIETQFKKTGDFPLSITNVIVSCETRTFPFFALSQLNTWRRDLVDNHLKNRQLAHPRNNPVIEPNIVPYPSKNLSFKANVANELARKFYSRHGVETIDSAFELTDEFEGKVLMTTRYCVLHELGYCDGKKRKPDTPKKLYLQDNLHKYPLQFNCNLCKMSVLYPDK
jgi:putative protease